MHIIYKVIKHKCIPQTKTTSDKHQHAKIRNKKQQTADQQKGTKTIGIYNLQEQVSPHFSKQEASNCGGLDCGVNTGGYYKITTRRVPYHVTR